MNQKAKMKTNRNKVYVDVVGRFWGKVAIRSKDECWLWAAHRNKKGYGSFALTSKKIVSSHRIAWAITNGGMPMKGEHILHSCDNPPCCNPFHLRKGTQQENTDDMMSRGRHGSAKLTEKDIPKIRAALAAGETRTSIGKRFGVNRGNIYTIAIGKAWRHVHCDTTEDMIRRGRQTTPRGSANGNSKLTEKDIPSIRRALSAGETQKSIGKRFGVGHATICEIASGKRWSHVQ